MRIFFAFETMCLLEYTAVQLCTHVHVLVAKLTYRQLVATFFELLKNLNYRMLSSSSLESHHALINRCVHLYENAILSQPDPAPSMQRAQSLVHKNEL